MTSIKNVCLVMVVLGTTLLGTNFLVAVGMPYQLPSANR